MFRSITFIKLTVLGFFAFAAASLSLRTVWADPEGAPASHTGAPGEQTCATSGCHNNFTLNSGSGTLTLTGLPANGYALNQDYTLTVTVGQSGQRLFGFQLTAIDSLGKQAGTLSLIETTRTQMKSASISGNARQYVGQSRNGVNPTSTNQDTWTVRWKSPTQAAGTVTFYLAGNAANGNGSTTGDYIYAKSFSLQPAVTLATVSAVSAASFAQGSLAGETIASLFGTNLAADVVINSTVPLPTLLGGVVVKVKDSANVERDSPLFFVSSGQINFLVPTGTANGQATMTVFRDGTAIAAGTITVENVTPGLFTANSSGQGAPAAVLLRVKADGTQIYESVAQYDQAQANFVATPIDFGAATDQLYLIVYGTGFRNRSSLAGVSCTIGGIGSDVFYVGPQGDFTGLDQANITLSRNLVGRGTVDLTFNVDGKTANTVSLNFK